MVSAIFEQIVNGIVSGSVYAIVAVGMTMIFGVLRAINFAHGEYYMLGTFGAWFAIEYFDLPYPVAIVIGVIATAVRVVKRLTSGTGQLVKARKIQYVQGLAEIVDAHHVRVTPVGEKAADPRVEIQFEHAILATGSSPVVPSSLKLDDARVMDSTGSRWNPDIPPSLLVVGGGYIGLEMGTVYAELGRR